MNNIVVILLTVSLTACAMIRSHEKLVQDHAVQAGLVAVARPQFDAAFVLHATDFSRYKKIIINDLDLSQATIIQPSSKYSFDAPWALNEEDRRYYQTQFSESAKRSLLDSGLFVLTTTNSADTLVLKTKITEIAPRASKDDFKSRPNMMDVYSEGFGKMTIVFELYDSTTNQLVMVATDRHDLGTMWELNNKVQNNMRIRLAFDFWLSKLQKELSVATAR